MIIINKRGKNRGPKVLLITNNFIWFANTQVHTLDNLEFKMKNCILCSAQSAFPLTMEF